MISQSIKSSKEVWPMLKKREEQENITFFTNVYGYILAFALKKI